MSTADIDRAREAAQPLKELFGISDEVHQFFIPGRTASAFDLGLDVAGICAGCWLFLTARLFYYRLMTSFRPLS
jgi:VanZ family protein